MPLFPPSVLRFIPVPFRALLALGEANVLLILVFSPGIAANHPGSCLLAGTGDANFHDYVNP